MDNKTNYDIPKLDFQQITNENKEESEINTFDEKFNNENMEFHQSFKFMLMNIKDVILHNKKYERLEELKELSYVKNQYSIYFSIVSNKYFDKNFADEKMVGNEMIFQFITLLLNEKISKLIHNLSIYPHFVKKFLEKLSDIMYWANKYKIVEIFDFIKKLLTFRKPKFKSSIDIIDYIMKNGGISYLKIEYKFACPYSRKELDELSNKLSDMDDYKKIQYYYNNRSNKNIFKSYEIRNNLNHTFERINFKRYCILFQLLDTSEELDINLLLVPTKIYSHFLWVYTNMFSHNFHLRTQSLPDNEFFNSMLRNCELLPKELSEMLKANLYVLNQI